MKIAALIPAFNEEDYIAQTIRAVASLDSVDEILVIDDGSSDNTSVLAQKTAKVLRLTSNQGKGAALNHGLKEVRADIYLLLDADLGSSAHLAWELVEPILHDQADMTIARFDIQHSAPQARMGFGSVRKMASLGVRLLTGTKVHSPLSGQRAIRVAVLDAVGDFFEGFGVEVALTVGALHHGFRLLEVPLAMKHRAYGRGLKGLRHRGRQGIHIIKALWQCYKRGWHL